MIKRFVISIAALLALTLPALAQFPPPGVYRCIDETGADWGTLTLFVAGDYEIASTVVAAGKGQVASAGNSVNALTGPLADVHLTGSFSLDERGEAVFLFETDVGGVECALPPL